MKNEKIGKVVWRDAVARTIDKDALAELIKAGTTVSGESLLAVNTTFGKIVELGDVVGVITEESTEDSTDTTVIPKCLIIAPKRFKK